MTARCGAIFPCTLKFGVGKLDGFTRVLPPCLALALALVAALALPEAARAASAPLPHPAYHARRSASSHGHAAHHRPHVAASETDTVRIIRDAPPRPGMVRARAFIRS
jgi:hypothetical protein